jgi:hypothetical protein
MPHSNCESTKLETSTEQKKIKSKVTKAGKLKPQKEPKTWLPDQYQRGDSFDPYYNQGIETLNYFLLP